MLLQQSWPTDAAAMALMHWLRRLPRMVSNMRLSRKVKRKQHRTRETWWQLSKASKTSSCMLMEMRCLGDMPCEPTTVCRHTARRFLFAEIQSAVVYLLAGGEVLQVELCLTCTQAIHYWSTDCRIWLVTLLLGIVSPCHRAVAT